MVALGGMHGFIQGGMRGFIWGGVCGFFSFFGYNEIRSMSGRYASYWNAFLFFDFFAFASVIAWCELAIKHSMRCKTLRSMKATSFLIRSCSERCQNNKRFRDFFRIRVHYSSNVNSCLDCRPEDKSMFMCYVHVNLILDVAFHKCVVY